ncbi:MAG: hypothetical protein JRG89_14150 [Deltaproteobacteria bacterium]|nr:hypothetical protein [Deltaproteobacteria bacterium]
METIPSLEQQHLSRDLDVVSPRFDHYVDFFMSLEMGWLKNDNFAG